MDQIVRTTPTRANITAMLARARTLYSSKPFTGGKAEELAAIQLDLNRGIPGFTLPLNPANAHLQTLCDTLNNLVLSGLQSDIDPETWTDQILAVYNE